MTKLHSVVFLLSVFRIFIRLQAQKSANLIWDSAIIKEGLACSEMASAFPMLKAVQRTCIESHFDENLTSRPVDIA